jgi:hypothetical protein
MEIELGTPPVRAQRIAISRASTANGSDLRWSELAVDNVACVDRDTRHLDAGMTDPPGVHMNMRRRVVVEVELDNQAIEAGDSGHTTSLRSDYDVTRASRPACATSEKVETVGIEPTQRSRREED